jgi:hypothetical protein
LVFLIALFAVSGSASRGSAAIGLPDCTGKLVVRPSSVVLACGDDNFQAKQLRWSGWGQSFAAAQGTASVNDCKPDCAAGHFHSYPVILIAKGRQTCSGRPAYAGVTYAFPAAAPNVAHPSSLKDATVGFRC